MRTLNVPLQTRHGPMQRVSVIHVPVHASERCRESMRRFRRLQVRLSIAPGTIVATLAMVTVICRTAHLLD
jgi:hypothetical protein